MSLLRLIAGLSLFWTLLIAATVAYGAASPGDEIIFDLRSEDQFITQRMDIRAGIMLALPLQSSSQHHAQWSPDGSQFAYLATDSDSPTINVVDPIGQGSHGECAIPFMNAPEVIGVTSDFSWSPDGTQVAVGVQFCLWILDVEGAVAPFNLSPAGNDVAYGAVAWSPDGTRLAFNYAFGTTSLLGIYDFTTEKLLLLTQGDDPDWSPDGSRIVYVSNLTVVVINADGGTPSAIGRGFSPSWSPDGEWIAFSQGFDSPVDLMLYNVETGQMHTLLSNGTANIMSDWR